MATKGGWKLLGVVGARQSWGSLCQASAPQAPAPRRPGASAVHFTRARGPGSCQLEMFPGRRIGALSPHALRCRIFPAKNPGKRGTFGFPGLSLNGTGACPCEILLWGAQGAKTSNHRVCDLASRANSGSWAALPCCSLVPRPLLQVLQVGPPELRSPTRPRAHGAWGPALEMPVFGLGGLLGTVISKQVCPC